MSFYVTLPSNSSMNFFPDNTLTQFTTKLHQPLQLLGAYEVALSEIIFPFTWLPDMNFSIEVGRKIDEKVDKVVYINIEEKIHVIKALTFHSLTDGVNKDIKDKGLTSSMRYVDATNRIYLYIGKNEYINFPNETKSIFGLQQNLFESNHEAPLPKPRLLKNIFNIFVYSDCSDYQYVGDTFSPLLRVVAVPNEIKYGDFVNISYDTPHYVPVSRNTINTIEIKLRTDTGEPIKFNYGKVLVKLHFRPKSTY